MVKNEDVQLVQPKKDHEIEMAKSQTKSVALNSVQILNTLKSGQYDELPAWVQSKLTLSKHNLQSVYDYMLGKHEQVTESSMDFAKMLKKRGFIKKGQDDKTREKQIEKYLDKWADKDFKGAYPKPWVRRIKIPGHGPAQDWWMDTFHFVGKLLGESTDKYQKSLEKIAKDKQLKMLSKKDKETLMKIASLMKKNESRNERKEELMRLTNMLEAKMRPNVKKLLKQKGYGPIFGAIDSSKQNLKQMKYSRGEIEDTLISMFGDEDQKILQKIKESINEKKGDFLNSLFPKSKVQKAIEIAKKMGGNMTGAVKKIEKFFPGMTLNTDVQDALRLANEGKIVGEAVSGKDVEAFVKEKGLKGMDLPFWKVGIDYPFYPTKYHHLRGATAKDAEKELSTMYNRASGGKIGKAKFDDDRFLKIHKNLKESVNEDVYAVVDKFDDKKQDYDQVYFKDNDLNKVKKHMKKMGSKYGKMNLIQVKSNGKMSLVERMDKRQAGVMLKQLGGNRFIMMTGAKNFGVGPKGAGFKIGRNSKGVNFVRIDLKNDLYDMEFFQVRAGKMKLKSKVKQIFADQLQDQFTKHTGMYTSL